MPHHPVAFRCRACGHFCAAGHAGIHDVPRACVACGAGVKHSPRGNVFLFPSNWEVLADATPARLAELGLTPADVERHAPCQVRDACENLARCSEARAVLDAKEALWKSKPLEAWQAELSALHAKADALDAVVYDHDDHARHAQVEHEKITLQQEIHDLLEKEWTAHDESNREEIQKAIDAEGKPRPGKPRKVVRAMRQRQQFGEHV